jgi:hypothetical protein
MKTPSAVRVLGAAGLVSAGLVTAGGFSHSSNTIGAGALLMFFANIYALVKGGAA